LPVGTLATRLDCFDRKFLQIGLVMNRLGLTLHPAKTRLVNLGRGKESFTFLGCTIRKKPSIQRNPRWHFTQRWPSAEGDEETPSADTRAYQ
jgi:hypothetical protein